jgi:thiamine-phosphate pyrophosphorylase
VNESHAVFRLLDAAANRAREALRVMEDIARFVLDDAELSRTLKDIRHDFAAALRGVDPGVLLASRDTPGDVGTGISTSAEYSREGLPSIAAAATKRLTEALRSVEECLKLESRAGDGENGGEAAVIEQLRYRAYDAEKRLLLALGTGRARQHRLCVLITESLCQHHTWEEVARQAIEGGADCLQLREKSLSDRELLRRARRLVGVARETGGGGVTVFVNDRPDIAMLSGADGVHVGQDDMSVADVRKLAGFALLVGVSTTNMDQALAAARDGADVCGVGPMFSTTTKEKPRIAGAAYLREYVGCPATARVPHLAIGGITADNLSELVAAGCQGIAASAAVCKEQRPAVACRALCDGLAPTH